MIDAIERRVEFDAEPQRVWTAITAGDELGTWFPNAGAFDLAPGAEGDFVWENHGAYAVRVEAFDPPRHVAWRWARDADTAIDDGPSTLVEFTLTPRPGGGTVLELRESGFVRQEDRESNVSGWKAELAELVEMIDG